MIHEAAATALRWELKRPETRAEPGHHFCGDAGRGVLQGMAVKIMAEGNPGHVRFESILNQS
jgi:hypothetical protein